MPAERLSMRKIEEILRLKYEMGLTHREITRSCAVSASTVSECVTHAKAASVSWPLPEGLDGAELEALLLGEMRRLDDPYRLCDQPDDGLPVIEKRSRKRQ